MAARDFNGTTSDKINYGSDASIDAFALKSVSIWCMLDTDSGAGATIVQKSDNSTAGWVFQADMTGSNNRLDFIQTWANLGRWHGPNSGFTTGVAHHVGVTYDGGATGNLPVLYMDGVKVTVTTTTAPSGSISSDAASSLLEGLNAVPAQGFDGRHNYLCYDNTIWTDAQMNLARWWGCPGLGIKVHHRLNSDKLTNEGTAVADGTASGTTMGVFLPTPVQPRGSVLMGMGVGW